MSLDTKILLDSLVKQGFTNLCTVSFSFSKFLINASINHSKIEYLLFASEPVAGSVTAGLKPFGARPIVFIQSSGITNIVSCIKRLLKPYNLKFSILLNWKKYFNCDSEIQHQHLASKLTDYIKAYGYDAEVEKLPVEEITVKTYA